MLRSAPLGRQPGVAIGDSMGRLLLPLLVVLAGSSPARAQNEIRGRVMVLVDTSGSMIWPFNMDGVSMGGDGDAKSLYTDVSQANKNFYPGKLVNGVPQGPLSRMYSAKRVLFDVVNAAGNLDFGLMRYAPDRDVNLCPNQTNCCNFNTGACVCNSDYINNPGGNKCNPGTDGLTTFYGGCGPIAGGLATDGAQVLVRPADANGNSAVVGWVDNVEDFRAGGPNGFPMNGELRAGGPTPLAGSVRTATEKWYRPIFTASKNGNCNPMQDPSCDPQINCRPYVFVVMTDGADTCDGDRTNGPINAVAALTAINPANPVKTYIVGLAFTKQADINILNSMAQRGGSTTAILVNKPEDLKGAFADIAQSSVKYELCNAKDDNCNGVSDEGYDKGAACTVGAGACLRNGIKKCEANGQGTRCCVDDGKPDGTCIPLAAGAPVKEVCGNNVDDDCNGVIDDPMVCMGGPPCIPTPEVCDSMDNDCNGKADDNPVDVAQPCGLALGICKQGSTECQAGKLACVGGTMPKVESCNNLDDDCDGIVDGMTRSCYSGPMGSEGQGICRGGQQKCSAGMFEVCIGEVLPKTEICNGVDDECNGKVDDVPGAGASCCPSGKCGMGACKAGTMQCSGGSLQCIGGQGPTPEICDQQDNDCNGMSDDILGLGMPCTPQGGCPGKLACDFMKQQVTCQPTGMVGKEICNGTDDDCDGLIDEQDPDTAMNDARLGKPCGNDKNLPPPCLAGKIICRLGNLVCDGHIGPQMEVCDRMDNDCDGKLDNSAPCPMNFACYDGACDPLCSVGEFPCPGGFSPVTVDGKCVCAPDKMCNPPCQPPLECDPSSGKCIDRCEGKKCPDGLTCDPRVGDCAGCERFGCKEACTRCNNGTHLCEMDKCCNVKCDAAAGEYCDPQTGNCLKTCKVACPAGQFCEAGSCVADKCAKVECPQGQACSRATGMCEDNGCFNKLCKPLACCKNACVPDPCAPVQCPGGTECRVDPLSCDTFCQALPLPPKEEIVAAGGAFSCSVARPGANTGGGFALSLLLVLGFLTARRRRGARAEV